MKTQLWLLTLLGVVCGGRGSFFDFDIPNLVSWWSMRSMLDGMQQMMTDDSTQKFDAETFTEFRSCLQSTDKHLPKMHDTAWNGIVNYWRNGGGKKDEWGSNPTGFPDREPEKFPLRDMIVHEPCGFVSSLAHYRLNSEVCASIKEGHDYSLSSDSVNNINKAFSFMTIGTGFLHASHTKLGALVAKKTFDATIYILHQESLAAFGKYTSSIMSDLSNKNRMRKSSGIVKRIGEIFKYKKTSHWTDSFDKLDIPDGSESLVAILTTMSILGTDEKTARKMLPKFINGFNLTADRANFMTEYYLPSVIQATKDVDVPKKTRHSLSKKFMTLAGKLMYGRHWLADTEASRKHVSKKIVNTIGRNTYPFLMRNMNKHNGNTYYTPSLRFDMKTEVYPGQKSCEKRFPRPKWYVICNSILIDFLYIVDEIDRLLRDHDSHETSSSSEKFTETIL